MSRVAICSECQTTTSNGGKGIVLYHSTIEFFSILRICQLYQYTFVWGILCLFNIVSVKQSFYLNIPVFTQSLYLYILIFVFICNFTNYLHLEGHILGIHVYSRCTCFHFGILFTLICTCTF